ncbi:MAG: TraB/GumN family protein [Pseudobacter sp.]|uniref:TraB/GumN family protein n=1 Tax=Pseudobacter sp. TaxID=2045420 RepID=UPI003F808910
MLWKISGNGLSKPSYLLGTIHLKDKRIFQFPESLYQAIDQTEGLALESDPHWPSVVRSGDSLARITLVKNRMKAANFKRISARLAAIFKKSPDEVTIYDLDGHMTTVYARVRPGNNMSTSLDPFLYSIAKKIGKWTGALEDRGDEVSVPTDTITEHHIKEILKTDEQLAKFMDSIITVYLSDDLGKFNKLYGSSSDSSALMVRRNLKMAARMDSLMHVRTMLFAVGLGHLDNGTNGLLTLMRKRGYTVEPVPVTKREFILDHPYTYNELPWVKVSSKDNTFSVDMPYSPDKDDISVIKGGGSQTYLFDFASGIYYSISAYPAPLWTSGDTVMKAVLLSFDSTLTLRDKRIEANGLTGKEWESENMKWNVRARFFEKQGIWFMLLAFNESAAELPRADVDRFFGSFSLDEKALAKTLYPEYSNAYLGLSVRMPEDRKPVRREENENARSYEVFASDSVKGVSYVLVTETLLPGYNRSVDIPVLDQHYLNFQNNASVRNLDFTDYKVEGMPVRVLRFNILTKQGSYYCSLLALLRGNKTYYLGVRSIDSSLTMEHEKLYYSSIRFLPPESKGWGVNPVPGNALPVWSPEPFIRYEDSTIRDLRYTTYDSAATTSMVIIKQPFYKYYWHESDTAFLRSSSMMNKKEGDSLLSFEFTQNGPFKAAEAYIRYASSQNIKRLRVMVNGDSLITLFTTGDMLTLRSPDLERFFKEFMPDNKQKPSTIFTNKGEAFLEALDNEDSTEFDDAAGASQAIEFSSKDLPLLYKGLVRPWKHEEQFINHYFAQKILEIKDPGSVNALQEMYNKQLADEKLVKGEILWILVKWNTAETHKIATAYLLKGIPLSDRVYDILNSYSDSLELTVPHVKTLLPLLKDSLGCAFVIQLCNKLMARKMMQRSMLDPYKEQLFSHTREFLASPDFGLMESNYWYPSSMVQMLVNLNDSKSIPYLRQFLHKPIPMVKAHAALGLLAYKQNVLSEELVPAAADSKMRNFLYDSLVVLKKESLFPVEYVKQQLFSESELMDITSGYKSKMVSIEFVAEKTEVFKNEAAKFLLFKMVFETGGEQNAYLGISGPFPVGTGAKPQTKGKISGVFIERYFNHSNLYTDLKEYISQYE